MVPTVVTPSCSGAGRLTSAGCSTTGGAVGAGGFTSAGRAAGALGTGGRLIAGAGASAAWARTTGRGGAVVIGWLGGADRAGAAEAMAAGTLYCGTGMAYCGANCCAGIVGGPPNIGAGHPAGPQPAPERAGLTANQQTAPTKQTMSGSASLRMTEDLHRDAAAGVRRARRGRVADRSGGRVAGTRAVAVPFKWAA